MFGQNVQHATSVPNPIPNSNSYPNPTSPKTNPKPNPANPTNSILLTLTLFERLVTNFYRK